SQSPRPPAPAPRVRVTARRGRPPSVPCRARPGETARCRRPLPACGSAPTAAAAPCAGGRPPGQRCVLRRRQRNNGDAGGPFLLYRIRIAWLCDGIGPEVNPDVILPS